MAGIIAVYGLVISVLIAGACEYDRFNTVKEEGIEIDII
jgi:hypothetical protein